jgi:dienelactone hydrolase
MKEKPLMVGPQGSLLGILTPAASAPATSPLCVVLLNAGLIHHVGPHRLHVKLARSIVEHGISAFRMDLSGIGDSPPRHDGMPAAQAVVAEPREAIDALARLGYERFVLFGICSGAKHALRAGADDPRVVGLVLVNQEATQDDPEAASRASAHYYLAGSARSARAWVNLLTGRVRYKPLVSALVRELRRRVQGGASSHAALVAQFRAELEPALRRDCRLLVVLSDRHARLVELLGAELEDLRSDPRIAMHLVPTADHLFTRLAAERELLELVCGWAASLAPSAAAAAPFERGAPRRHLAAGGVAAGAIGAGVVGADAVGGGASAALDEGRVEETIEW